MTSSSSGVVITGMGAICALGDRPDTIHDALCDGRRGFGVPSLFPAEVAPGHVVAEVRELSPQAYLGGRHTGQLDRTGRLAAVAVQLTLAHCGLSGDLQDTHPLGLILGTMFCSVRTIGEFDRRAQRDGPEYASPMDFSNTVLNAAAGQVALWHDLRAVHSTISTGAASGLQAIGYAAGLIRMGRATALIAGGVDEVCFESFYGFRRARLLAAPIGGEPGCGVPFGADRTGLVLGEGAAFLALEAEDSAVARGARVLGRVEGFGSTFDPGPPANCQRESRALASAIERALAESRVAPSAIGAVAASASGSPVQDAREASTIEAAIGTTTPVTAIKSMVGETLGASGPLQLMTVIESMRRGRLPGIAGLDHVDASVKLSVAPVARSLCATRALVTSMASEGNCCALVIGRA